MSCHDEPPLSKRNVLTPDNLLSIILSEKSVTAIRRELRQKTDVSVTPEEVIGALRRLLNEAALGEMERVHISLPQKTEAAKKTRVRPSVASTDSSVVARRTGEEGTLDS